jgi:putative ABC transport system ATP-binding protein
MQLFATLANEGKTIIIVTHDLDLAKRVKRIIKLKDGKIEEFT